MCFFVYWSQIIIKRSGEKSEYEIIKEEIRKAVPKGRAAGVLRLVFHDAGTFEVNDKSGIST